MLIRSNICNLIYHISENWLNYSVSVSVPVNISFIYREELYYELSPTQWPSVKAGGEVRRKQTKCTFRPPMWTKHWGIWRQRSSLVSRKEKPLIVFLFPFTSKKNASGFVSENSEWGKNFKSQSSVSGKSVSPQLHKSRSRRTWILFLWLHTGVHTDRSSDPGLATYTFHNNVKLWRPLDETAWYLCHSHTEHMGR